MSIKTWFIDLIGRTKTDNGIELVTSCPQPDVRFYVKQLAIQTAINLIANTIACSEFLTYDNGERKKGINYYMLNVSPNVNKSASKFWRDVASKLIFDNECLVIIERDGFFVVDSFDKKEYAFRENIYKNIVINNFKLDKSYTETEVFHFELHDTNMGDIITGLYKDYGELIEYSKATYKRSNARRGVLTIPTTYPKTQESNEALQKLLNRNFKRFIEAENGAILPLTNGLTFADLSNATYKNGSDSRDIRQLIDDIFDFVAIGFNIPPQLLKGTVAESDKSIDNFITFCINPIAQLLTDEINRKYLKKDDYLSGSFVKMDTTRVRSVNLKDLANSIDILTRNGANSVNDSLEILNRERIKEEWADEHFITRNLMRMDEAMHPQNYPSRSNLNAFNKSTKGGDSTNEKPDVK